MGIVTLGVSATGRHVAAIGADNVLRVWSSSGGRVLREPDALGALQRPETTGTPSYGYTLRPVQVFVSDQQAIGLTADGRLGTWPFDGQSSAVDFERPVTAFSAVGGTIAFAIDGAAAVAQDGAVLRNIPQACPDAAPVTSLLLAPDRRRLAVMCPWATTLLYDLESGESFRTDHHERGGGTAFAFSPDGRTYAHGNNGAGSLNIHGEVEITDAATGEAVQTFGSRLIRTADLAFNPARPELALYWDGGAHVWDLEEGRVVARSFGRSRDLAYAADGESIWLLDSGRDTASQTYRWDLNLAEIARVWTNGCIIRSALMEELVQWLADERPLLLQPEFIQRLRPLIPSLDELVALGAARRAALPCFAAAAQFLHGYAEAEGSASMIQAQRDYFGAHTYRRNDRDASEVFHTEWPE